MSSPYDEGRDGSTGDYRFDAPPPGDLNSGVAAQTGQGYDTQLPTEPHPGADLPPAGRFTYPWLRGPGGALADD